MAPRTSAVPWVFDLLRREPPDVRKLVAGQALGLRG
jgi:hypothetical protein